MTYTGVLTKKVRLALEEILQAETYVDDVWVVAVPMESEGWQMVHFYYPAIIGYDDEWGYRLRFSAPVSVPFKDDEELFNYAYQAVYVLD